MSDIRYFIAQVETPLTEGVSKRTIDKAIRELLYSIDWSGGDGTTVLFDMGYDPEGDEENLPNQKSRKFVKELRDWAWSRCMEAQREIEWRFENGKLPVWRVITAPKDWTPDDRHPGIYWSWDERAADAHWGEWGNGHVKWLLHAEVSASDIDWVSTLAANGNPTLGEDEKEVTIREGVPVEFTYKRV